MVGKSFVLNLTVLFKLPTLHLLLARSGFLRGGAGGGQKEGRKEGGDICGILQYHYDQGDRREREGGSPPPAAMQAPQQGAT